MGLSHGDGLVQVELFRKGMTVGGKWKFPSLKTFFRYFFVSFLFQPFTHFISAPF